VEFLWTETSLQVLEKKFNIIAATKGYLVNELVRCLKDNLKTKEEDLDQSEVG